MQKMISLKILSLSLLLAALTSDAFNTHSPHNRAMHLTPPRSLTRQLQSAEISFLEEDLTAIYSVDSIFSSSPAHDFPVSASSWERQEKGGMLKTLKTLIFERKMERSTLAKLSTSVLPAYGAVGSVCGSTAVSCAWYIASCKTGLSPLAPGQWKAFLNVYGGFFVVLNLIRPLRFAMALFVSKYYERIVDAMFERFDCSKATAVGLSVFFVNFCGGTAFLTGGIVSASCLSGVPIWPAGGW